jgi:uridine kinase
MTLRKELQMPQFADLDTIISTILERRKELPKSRSLLVGLSGIDGSGKSYLATQIVARLWQTAVHAVSINVDGWLNLPEVRFSKLHPARHFYDFAIRFDQLFEQLVTPLRTSRSHRVIADHVSETSMQFEKHLYEFTDVEVIVLEGIFLFKTEYVEQFDLKIWTDCSFETALARALSRRQEKLSPAETIHAYEKIYFPAQRLHFRQDHPRDKAELVLQNDSAGWGSAARSGKFRLSAVGKAARSTRTNLHGSI